MKRHINFSVEPQDDAKHPYRVYVDFSQVRKSRRALIANSLSRALASPYQADSFPPGQVVYNSSSRQPVIDGDVDWVRESIDFAAQQQLPDDVMQVSHVTRAHALSDDLGDAVESLLHELAARK